MVKALQIGYDCVDGEPWRSSSQLRRHQDNQGPCARCLELWCRRSHVKALCVAGRMPGWPVGKNVSDAACPLPLALVHNLRFSYLTST